MDLATLAEVKKVWEEEYEIEDHFVTDLISAVDRLTALCEEQGRDLQQARDNFDALAWDWASGPVGHEFVTRAITAESAISQAREEVELLGELLGERTQDYLDEIARAEAAEQREKGLREALEYYAKLKWFVNDGVYIYLVAQAALAAAKGGE